MRKLSTFFLIILLSNAIFCNQEYPQLFLEDFQQHLTRGFRVPICAKFVPAFYLHSGNSTYNRDQVVTFLMNKKRNFEKISIFNSTSSTNGESQYLVYLEVNPRNEHGKSRFFEIYLSLLRLGDYYILGGNEVFNK